MSTIDMSKNEALDKKAENARELGLDYEPAPVQQEPEWYHFVRHGDDCFVPYKGQAPANATALYTSPPTLSLAQQEQEPVYLVWMEAHSAWLHTDKDGFDKVDPENRWLLYTSPLAPQEPVATDWERIARVQDAKLRAMCNESGGFEKLCEVMDRYEHTSPPAQQEIQRLSALVRAQQITIDKLEAQRKPLTYEEITAISKQVAEGGPNDSIDRFVRAIEAAHGIKENI